MHNTEPDNRRILGFTSSKVSHLEKHLKKKTSALLFYPALVLYMQSATVGMKQL